MMMAPNQMRFYMLEVKITWIWLLLPVILDTFAFLVRLLFQRKGPLGRVKQFF